jgi:hypothetical protein
MFGMAWARTPIIGNGPRYVIRRSRLSLAVTCGVLASALGATPALADPEDSPNAVTITFTCPFGQITGTSPAGIGALFAESGAIVTLHGLTELGGEVIGPITPGLESTGKLVPCTFFSPSRQREVVGYLLIIP